MRKTLTIHATAPDRSEVKYNVSYVSTTATNAQLKTFATQLNNLTKNTFDYVELTTIEDITDAD